MSFADGIYSLKGIVQHYSWGGYDFIPSLLGIKNLEQKPFAEYWLGAHPNYSSFIENGYRQELNRFMLSDRKRAMGQRLEKKYSSLPYLFKVLDVRQMLSIQVHPSKESAEIGFEEENKMNIPLKAPNRNYRDNNHKPELMAALGDFWLLHGFKPPDLLKAKLETIPEFVSLLELFNAGGYKALYDKVMNMPQAEVNDLLNPLLDRIKPLYERRDLKKDQEDFWVARAAHTYHSPGKTDRGIFSIYLFNLLHLKKGEGIYQPSGLPHAYLEGQNVEVMANSDNVLRSGLTDKHIDIAELMKHVKTEATFPDIIYPDEGKEGRIFHSPAREFELIQWEAGNLKFMEIETASPEIWLITEGNLSIQSSFWRHEAKKGDAFFVIPGMAASLNVMDHAVVFRVRVPGG